MSRPVDALLADEIERRVPLLAGQPSSEDARRVLHAMRGSAALAGHADLALVLAHLGAQIRAGELDASETAHAVLTRALERLRRGEPPLPTRWPRPPEGLGTQLPDAARDDLAESSIRERLQSLAELDQADDPLRAAHRIVHSIKGAAAAVGNDLLAWYCHGLEAYLGRALEGEVPGVALGDLATHRAALVLIVDDPERALLTLRAEPGSVPPSARARPADASELTIRARSIDVWLERLEELSALVDALAAQAEQARAAGDILRQQRAVLLEALRQIGPPRPWGAPASAIEKVERVTRILATLTEGAERSRQVLRGNADAIGRRYGAVRGELARLRQASVRDLLDRVARATERTIAHEARLVRVDIDAPDMLIDRTVAERLFDPLLQLVRNAVAHGVEPSDERARRGKPAVGVITLRAEPFGDWLRLFVEDDGRGIDLDALRRAAVARGIVSDVIAAEAAESELLDLLFSPGFSTALHVDVLAGRGIGLELAQAAISSQGGALRLSSRAGAGVTATIEVPSERAMMDVVWVVAGSMELALPLRYVGRVCALEGETTALAAVLGLPVPGSPKMGIEIAVREQTRVLAVDEVGRIETARLFPFPRLVAPLGPYAGSVLRRDGVLGLVLDARAMAARAWAMPSG